MKPNAATPFLTAIETIIKSRFVEFNRNAESIKINFRFLVDPQVTKISVTELQMFFEGSAYTVDK